jgi:RNA polymerase-binding transcription factor DksA
MNIFKRQTPEEAMRESKRDIRRGQRDIERDVREMERQEKQLIIEIKALAKKGDNASAKIMTKQLLNVRKQKEKLLTSKGAPSPTQFSFCKRCRSSIDWLLTHVAWCDAMSAQGG